MELRWHWLGIRTGHVSKVSPPHRRYTIHTSVVSLHTLQHTETLNIVFLIYFRILKKAQKSVLLPSVLEGLAKWVLQISSVITPVVSLAHFFTLLVVYLSNNSSCFLFFLRFAHLINLEFFDDLLKVLHDLIMSGVSICTYAQAQSALKQLYRNEQGGQEEMAREKVPRSHEEEHVRGNGRTAGWRRIVQIITLLESSSA